MLIRSTKLAKKLTEIFQIPFSSRQINYLREKGVIKGIDESLPGSKRASWRYPEKENIETLKKLQKESK